MLRLFETKESTKSDDSRKKEFKGKVDIITFAGQHSFTGGVSSCVFTAAIAAQYFLNVTPSQFFKEYGPHLSEHKKMVAGLSLSRLTNEANILNLKYSKTLSKWLPSFLLNLSPKEFSAVLSYAKSNKGFNKISDLKIMAEASCDKEKLKDFCELIYSRYVTEENNDKALNPNDFAFLCGAAYHEIAFFAKIRPSDKKIFYYIFDTSPARAVGGNKNQGSLEIHTSLESGLEALTARWRVKYTSASEGDIYAVASESRIKTLQLREPSAPSQLVGMRRHSCPG